MSVPQPYLSFFPDARAPQIPAAHDQWFVFSQNKILADSSGFVPRTSDIESLRGKLSRVLYLGRSLEACCFAAQMESSPESIPEGFALTDVRMLFRSSSETMIFLCSHALELLTWDQQNRFCGACGSQTRNKDGERAKECLRCGLIRYPKISPAVIVAVVKGNKLLLAHKKDSPLPFHSVLAGFVEAGEPLETCVKREVFEEVGLEVTNIRYFGSQPWPFPDSLMIAFTAEHAGGDIKIDNKEIEHAAWYGSDDLPQLPPHGTVSRRLIDWFVQASTA